MGQAAGVVSAMRPIFPELRQRQAHHEAAHAVIAVHEKFGLHFARLGPQPQCLTNGALNRIFPSAVAEVRFLVAGFVADRRYAPALAARENFENSHDFEQALRLVEEDHLQILLRETERIVAERWRAVEAVAAALLERKRLEALEIYKIIVKAR